jgi:hypothetical protein
MANEQTHIMDQIVVAARGLSAAAGAKQEQWPEAEAVTLLEDEIRILRERGFTEECINGLFTGFDIEVKTEPPGPRWALPVNNQLIRLIWGKIHPN